MPVTARLSRNFYDRFGDDVANELVEWFNAVDASYRANFVELNDLSFARFEAKLDGLQVARRFGEVDRRFGEMDRRFDMIDARLAKVDDRFMKVDERFAAVDRHFDALGALLREHLLIVDGRFDRFEARLLRWILSSWIGTLMGLAALMWALMRAR